MTATAVQGLTAERSAAQAGALIERRPALAAFAITGKDRLSWLNGLVTCDVSKLRAGSGVYGLAVGKTGKIIAELWFVAAKDHVVVVLEKDRVDLICEHFDRHLIMEDVEMGEVLPRSVVFVHGPLAADLAAEARALHADAALMNWTGRAEGAVIVAPEGGLDAVMDALIARGRGLSLVATQAGLAVLRIEWGVPRFGVDYDDQTLAHEASLEKIAVSFNKGCYLGQEAIVMLEQRGHAKKRLMRLWVEGDTPLAAGTEITLAEGGDVLGNVTSATSAPEGGAQVALGYVKFKHAVAGTALSVGGRKARALGLATSVGAVEGHLSV